MDIQSDLFQAATKQGDLAALKDLLLQHVPPEVFVRYLNSKGPDGWTPIHTAAYWGRCDVLRFFLTCPGVDIRDIDRVSTDYEQITPFYAAVRGDQLEAMNLLVEHGADVQVTNFAEHTALHEAARNGSVAIITRLLELGLKVDAVGVDNATPLHYALQERQDAAANLLREKEGEHSKGGDNGEIANKVGDLSYLCLFTDDEEVDGELSCPTHGTNAYADSVPPGKEFTIPYGYKGCIEPGVKVIYPQGVPADVDEEFALVPGTYKYDGVVITQISPIT